MGSRQQRKAKKVMGEFRRESLFSGSGEKVTERKQAVAITLAEARKNKTGLMSA